MPAVSGSIPNLIGGVSQQPPEIRSLNASTALVNSWSSVVSGLGTRPGTEFIGDIGAEPLSGKTVASHGIKKPSGSYIVSVCNGAVSVVDLSDGTVKTVVVEDNADAYLNVDDAAVNIRFSTIGDTTFILNRTVVTAASQVREDGRTGITSGDNTRLNPNLVATHWVKQSAGYNCNFTIYLNNVLLANVTTDHSPDQAATYLRNSLTAASIPFTAVSSTITSIELAKESNFITATDGFGDQATLGYNDHVTEFTDLPNMDIGGRLVMIRQDVGDDGDDYWVWRNKGSWEETYGWDANESLQASTLPVKLVDNLDGTFTLKHVEWTPRQVGDADSNPAPSFVGRKISDMFRFKGRLVFLSDENVVMSQKGTLENFYRTTCTQLIDEDRIDIAASESR